MNEASVCDGLSSNGFESRAHEFDGIGHGWRDLEWKEICAHEKRTHDLNVDSHTSIFRL